MTSLASRRNRLVRGAERLWKVFQSNRYLPIPKKKGKSFPIRNVRDKISTLKRGGMVERTSTAQFTPAGVSIRKKNYRITPTGRINHYQENGISVRWASLTPEQRSRWALQIMRAVANRHQASGSRFPIIGVQRRVAPGYTTIWGLLEGHRRDVEADIDSLNSRMSHQLEEKQFSHVTRLRNYASMLEGIITGIERGTYKSY